MLKNIYWYLRSFLSPWAAYFHFRNLCAKQLRTGGKNVVLRGPFAGMEIGKHGSAIQLPMLVGSYELEIWPFLREIQNLRIQHSIHLGAANGYFAIGFAWKFRHMVTAFESRPEERKGILETAKRNGVNSRIDIQKVCQLDDLDKEIHRTNTMIFCDIDGAEEELLNPQRLPHLAHIPILVETHPLQSSRLHSRDLLQQRFSSTHIIREAAMKPRFPHEMGEFSDQPGVFRLRGLENEILAAALEERRAENTWLWMVPIISDGKL